MSSTTPPPPSRSPPSHHHSPLTSSPVPFPSPSSSASFSRGGTPGKRKQVKNACVNCQRACKKCDDQRPCSRCVKYGIEDGCTNSQRKERKRKSEPDSPRTPQLSSSTRIQLNMSSASSSSRRLRTEDPTVSQESLAALRYSSRNGIRPFPKELLESLQDDHENDAVEEQQNRDRDHDQTPLLIASMCPQVTEEFKTLARICSDLHTVIMSQPILAHHPVAPVPPGFRYPNPQASLLSPPPAFLYQRINPFSHGFNGIPRSVSPPPTSQYHHHQLHSHPQLQMRSLSPPPGPIHIRHSHSNFNSRFNSNSSAELLRTASSPIFNPVHPPQQLPIPRDLLNRTPPEDTPIDPSDEFDKETL